ncbi:MAG: FliC/FljB family flagellin [Castellaniella sp.]|uniref:FliC/FljB family flagellin n=1 Tax=Castellaniella sp. TaxID=1955812 RepID=UPI003C718623
MNLKDAVINTNYLALVSQNNLNKSQSALGSAIERLSSGLRINSAKDDAAGQAIANRFTANIKGLTQAARNSNDGISLAQTTEGALTEINNNLQRIRELSVQAATGSNSESDLSSIQDEIQQRLDEIDRVSAQTQFNGVKVLAKDNELIVQVGANDNETISIKLNEITASTLGLNGFNVDGSGRIANTAATTANLPAGATDNGDGTHTASVANTALTAAQALAQMSDGNTVDFTDAGGATTYTYDAASGKFTYADSLVAADSDFATVVSDIAGKIGNSTSFNVTFGGTQTNVKVDSTGNLTADNGDKLYISTTGELTAAPTETGLTQATLSDVVKLAGETAGAKIEHSGVTYETTTPDAGGDEGVISIGGSTISAADLAAKIEGGTATADTTVNIGNPVVGGSITLGQTDGVSTNAYTDAAGKLTDQANTTSTYTETDGGLTVNGKKVYVGEDGALTTDADHAGTRTVDPLAALDKALAQVDKLRSGLGAIQNRFESTIANLNNTITNLSAARSRIEDADYAVEVSNMTRAQILQQAGTAVLAQANQVPQTMLSLLR